jgi:hypothetical protein
LNPLSLCQEGYDTVFCPGSSNSKHSVDRFFILDPAQSKVEYVVHYDLGTIKVLPNPSKVVAIPEFAKKVFTPADFRTIKDDDPVFKAAWNAESNFYKMQSKQGNSKKIIKSVTVIQNRKLLAAFEEKRKQFLANKIPANPIYAYHGTKSDPKIMDNILQNNFDMKFAKRKVHGPGHYFSEFPDVSLGYGPGLIFCQLLSSKEFSGSNLSWPGYDSKVN